MILLCISTSYHFYRGGGDVVGKGNESGKCRRQFLLT